MKLWFYPWYRPANLWVPCLNTVERIRIIARWLPVLWNDYDWDRVAIIRVMEHKFLRHAHYAEHHGHLLSSPRQARELRIAAALCKRIRESNHSFVIGREPQDWGIAKPFGERAYRSRLRTREDGEDRDFAYLLHFMGRKFSTWWD